MTFTTYSSPLLAHVQMLLRERPRSVTIRALAAELECTPATLSLFACGKNPNPGALLVEKLYVRLTGRQLVNHSVSEPTA